LLHKGEKRIFIETEKDEYGDPMGTWLDKIVENIPENAKVTFIIDFE
jgi:hypothetical protein